MFLILMFSLPLFLPPFPSLKINILKIKLKALAGVAQWIERGPVNQRVASLIPSEGTCLGCGPGPRLGTHKRQPHIDDSLPFFL